MLQVSQDLKRFLSSISPHMACKHRLTPLHMAKYKGNKGMLLSCTSKIAPGFRLTTEAMNTYFCYAFYERSRGKQLAL